jgi:hypothetical protein
LRRNREKLKKNIHIRVTKTEMFRLPFKGQSWTAVGC